MAKVALVFVGLALLAASAAVNAQVMVDARKGAPLLIQAGNTTKLIWRTRPPHPDAVMCCGGSLQLSWSPMDSGVDHSVVLNIDDTCPNTLKNQQYVQYIFQAAPRGLVALDFSQNGDYYISDGVANHCSQQGMQFLLAVRGCASDNTIYTPVVPINVPCKAPSSALGLPGAAGASFGAGGAGAGASGLSASLQQRQQERMGAGLAAADAEASQTDAAGGRKAAGAAVAVAAGAALLLAAL